MVDDEPVNDGRAYRTSASQKDDACRVVYEGRRRVRFGCGHRSQAIFALELFGDLHRVSADLLKKRKRCGACELEHVRSKLCRCAICGGAILPGNPIFLYPYHPPKNVDVVVVDRDGEPFMVGCLRMGCAVDLPSSPSYWIGNGLICDRSGSTRFLGRVRTTTLMNSA